MYRSTPKTYYVYLICVDDGPMKIGSTCRLKHRVKNLSAGIWLPYQTHLIRCNDAKESLSLERHLQKSLVSKRIKGEWFESNVADVETLLTGSFSHLSLGGNESDTLLPSKPSLPEPSFNVLLC